MPFLNLSCLFYNTPLAVDVSNIIRLFINLLSLYIYLIQPKIYQFYKNLHLIIFILLYKNIFWKEYSKMNNAQLIFESNNRYNEMQRKLIQ